MKKFFGIKRRSSKRPFGRDINRESLRSVTSDKSLVIQLVRGAYNIDLTKVDDSFTKLHRACFFKYDITKIRKYLKQGYNPNLLDNVTRSSSLHLATVNGDLETIKVLLENGANRNLQDGDGKTPIVKAIECNNHDVIQFIIFSGINPNIQDYQFANSPLHWSIYEKNIEAAKLLLNYCHSIDVNLINHNQDTPLHLAVKSQEFNDIVHSLIEHHAKIDAKNCSSLTPLMIATSHNNLKAVQILVSKGANLHIKDGNGKTCFDFAHKVNNQELVNYLYQASSEQFKSNSGINETNLLIDSWPTSKDEEPETTDYDKRQVSKAVIDELKLFHEYDTKKWTEENIERYKKLVNQPICTTDLDLDSIHDNEDKDDVNDKNGQVNLNRNLSDSLMQFSSSPSHNPFHYTTDHETPIKSENKIQNVSNNLANSTLTNDRFIEQIKNLLEEEIKDNDEIDNLLFESEQEFLRKFKPNATANGQDILENNAVPSSNSFEDEKVPSKFVSSNFNNSNQAGHQKTSSPIPTEDTNQMLNYSNTATATLYFEKNSEDDESEESEQTIPSSPISFLKEEPSNSTKLPPLHKEKASIQQPNNLSKNTDTQVQTDDVDDLDKRSSLTTKEAEIARLEQELKRQSAISMSEIENLNKKIDSLNSELNLNHEKYGKMTNESTQEKARLRDENRKLGQQLELKKTCNCKETDQDMNTIRPSFLSSQLDEVEFLQKLHNLNEECNLLRKELTNEKALFQAEIGQLTKEKEIFSNENKWLKDKLDQLKNEVS